MSRTALRPCARLAEDGRAVGTGRLLPDGHIGRMAVLKEWRGKGVGALLLHALIEQARTGVDARVRLNAQLHAAGFYRRLRLRCFGSGVHGGGTFPTSPMERDLRLPVQTEMQTDSSAGIATGQYGAFAEADTTVAAKQHGRRCARSVLRRHDQRRRQHPLHRRNRCRYPAIRSRLPVR